MREADVIKMLLQQKDVNIPYKGMKDDEQIKKDFQ